MDFVLDIESMPIEARKRMRLKMVIKASTM